MGKFKFSSSLQQSVDLIFGETKFALAPGASTVVEAKMKEGGRTIGLSLSMGLRKVFSQQWPHVNELRGLFFLSGSREGGVRVTRFVDFPRPLEQALGYGLAPIAKPRENQFSPGQF